MQIQKKFICIVTTNKALRTRKFVSICLTKVNAQDMTLYYGILYKHSHMTVLSLHFFLEFYLGLLWFPFANFTKILILKWNLKYESIVKSYKNIYSLFILVIVASPYLHLNLFLIRWHTNIWISLSLHIGSSPFNVTYC